MGTSALSMVGLGGTLQSQVEGTARDALAAQDIVGGSVTYATFSVQGTLTGAFVQDGRMIEAAVPPGDHYALRIHLPDAVAAARAARGDFVVGLGARMGMDLVATVRDTVRDEVCKQLAAYGISAVVVIE